MKSKDAKATIQSVIDTTFSQMKGEEPISETFLATLITEIIASCGDECQSNVNAAQLNELNECLRNAVRVMGEYEQTTQNISAMTEKEMPEISDLISSGSNERIAIASGRLNELQAKLKNELSKADETIKMFRTHMEEMKRKSKVDKLTKTLNQSTYHSDMVPILRIGEDRDLDLCMLMIRIANLEAIRNERGDEAADKILIYVSKLLAAMIRQENRIYRYDTNTFLIVLNRSGEEQLENTEKRITERLSKQRVVYGDVAIELTIISGKSYHKQGDTVDRFTERCMQATSTIVA